MLGSGSVGPGHYFSIPGLLGRFATPLGAFPGETPWPTRPLRLSPSVVDGLGDHDAGRWP